jgi:hypothetical protein
MVFKGIGMLVVMFAHFCNSIVFFAMQASCKSSEVWGVGASSALVPKSGRKLQNKCQSGSRI